MIKILFFIEDLIGGGAEKVLRDLVNHLDQTKFDITVQTVWPCDHAKYLASGIRYKSIYTSKNKINLFLYRAEAESGFTYRFHIKDDYDIECAYLEMGTTKIMSGSTNRKAKKLAWVHCDLLKAVNDPFSYAKKAMPWYAKFDQIVCVSSGVKNSFDELFQNRFTSNVLQNVIDDVSIREKASQDPEDYQSVSCPVIMAVGRLSRPKNYYRLLKAHEQILAEGFVHHLWIIGEGEERPGLERYCAEHYLTDTVFLPGFRDNPYAYMRRADILVCSSLYEGLSTFVIEGIILGKPIVTTDCYGMREILGDSEYGLITENEDDAFTDGLRRMLQDYELRKYYEHQAAKRGTAFSAAALTDNTEKFFTALVEGKHR